MSKKSKALHGVIQLFLILFLLLYLSPLFLVGINAFKSYQEIMTTYTTKNRSTPFYYLDTSEMKDIDNYVEKTFDTNVSYPTTFVIKDGKVAAKKEGYNQYYSLYDFIKENFK